MLNLLVKIFVKNHDDIKNEKVRTAYGTLASCFGIVSNLVVSLLKLIAGFMTNTISIVADGFNNLSDMLSSLISLFGFKMSQKKADKEHPYGHQRIEYIASFIVSVIIVVLGVQLISDSVEKIRHPEAISDKFILNVVILVIAIFIKLYQALFNYSIGKKINSIALKATASDSRNDVIATSAVLIGLIISHFSNYNLDGYIGLLVGLLICYSGFKLVFESASPLIGEAPNEKLIEDIKTTINRSEIILGIHDLQIHSYGPSINFASCDVEVDSRLDLVTVHEEIDNIESICREKYQVKLTIHVDPVLVGDKKTEMCKEFVEDIMKDTFDFKYAIPDFRIVNKTNSTKIVCSLVIPYDVKIKDEDIIRIIEEKVKERACNLDLHMFIDHTYTDSVEL